MSSKELRRCNLTNLLRDPPPLALVGGGGDHHIYHWVIYNTMTSGTFHSINANAIRVNRDERQRKSLDGIDSLADSIKRLGLIHPVVITRDNVLVAGERRLSAIRSLGWDRVPCQYTDELDVGTLRAIELEENIKRQDLSWQDQCKAVSEYHEIRCAEPKRIDEDGKEISWTQEETANALGLKQNTVSTYLGLQKEIGKGNTDLLKHTRLSTAAGTMVRAKDRRNEEIMQTLYPEDRKDSIICADFNEWVTTYKGPKFNFIHCDFPYGIEADKMKQGHSVALHGGYDDSEDTYWRLLTSLLSSLGNLADESCHLMFWFSMHYYAPTLDYITRNSDFKMDPFPLVWMKSDNIGLLPDPQRGPRRIYETALFGARGDRKVANSVSNAIAAPTDRTQHMSTKPVFVLSHFFRMFVDSSTKLLDPTAGSGSALRAAESLHCSLATGVERDAEFARRANLSLNSYRRMLVK
ncbi:MAG TPA: ParB N-terminal domain-containing protein [Candidatus Bathyarchaeia archaeon]|nr:ParB N-terminal domain-containing protein [Candidatus Bathyarchaeia archaeon]